MADYRNVTACRLCDSGQLVKALDLGETPLANELDGTELFPLVVNQCQSCGHHQLSIAVNAARLWGPSYPYQSGTSPVFRAHLEKLADEVATMKPGGRVLEIASNDGTLVRMLAYRGLYCFGVDPSGPTEGLDGAEGSGVGNYTLLQQSWPPAQPRLLESDIILALNVFAHVDDLHGFTAAVKEALAPDGVFIVEVGAFPEVTSWGLFDTIYHEHMSYHTVGPLAKFFARHGLAVCKAKFVRSQGGSYRLYVGHAKGGDLMSGAELLMVPCDAALLKAHIKHAQGTVREATKSAKLICGYGAPAKLTTLAYTLDLPPIACIGEDNPLKVGRTTPGQRIPIVSVADMLAREPDCIIVFAWNFFDDISAKLRQLGFTGDIVNPMGAP